MSIVNTDDVNYRRAKQRVEELKGFYVHLAIFLVANSGLLLINLVTAGVWWFYWPLLGWGIGLAAHAIVVFAVGGRMARDWEERKIQKLMEHGDR